MIKKYVRIYEGQETFSCPFCGREYKTAWLDDQEVLTLHACEHLEPLLGSGDWFDPDGPFDDHISVWFVEGKDED